MFVLVCFRHFWFSLLTFIKFSIYSHCYISTRVEIFYITAIFFNSVYRVEISTWGKNLHNNQSLKQNFLCNHFKYFSKFFHLSLGYCQFHLHIAVWHYVIILHSIIQNWNELLFSSLWKRLLSNLKIFVIESTNKIFSIVCLFVFTSELTLRFPA